MCRGCPPFYVCALGWSYFEGWFDGSLNLSFKDLQTNLNFDIVKATTLSGLKVGLIHLNAPFRSEIYLLGYAVAMGESNGKGKEDKLLHLSKLVPEHTYENLTSKSQNWFLHW